MTRPALLGLLVVAAASADDAVKIPVQVDQAGKTIYFVTDADSNVPLEAVRFCATHLPTVTSEECANNLVEQVTTVRSLRAEAQQQLPGISFTLKNSQGESLRFVHEEGADPAEEARTFCEAHFDAVPQSDCVEHMLKSAARALDEINAKHADPREL